MVNLLILVACLAIERYLHIGSMMNRFSWLGTYLTKLESKIPNNSPMGKGFLGVLVAITPIVAIVAVLLGFLISMKIALSGAGAYFILLIYCFGPKDLFSQAEIYFASAATKDQGATNAAYKELTGKAFDSTESELENGKKLAETVFVEMNACIFGVLCWYMIAGIIGVLVYRLISLIAQMAQVKKEVCGPFAEAVCRLNDWLNWLPSRIAGLCYVLTCGLRILSVWKSQEFSSVSNNNSFLITCGMAALKNKEEGVTTELSSVDEGKNVMSVVDKALIFFIAASVIIELFFWIFNF